MINIGEESSASPGIKGRHATPEEACNIANRLAADLVTKGRYSCFTLAKPEKCVLYNGLYEVRIHPHRHKGSCKPGDWTGGTLPILESNLV